MFCEEDGQSFYSEAFEMTCQVLELLKIQMDVREKNMLVDGFEQECLAQLNSGEKAWFQLSIWKTGYLIILPISREAVYLTNNLVLSFLMMGE